MARNFLVASALLAAGVALLLGRRWLAPGPEGCTLEAPAPQGGEEDPELEAVRVLAAGPDLNGTQATVLAFVPCGRVGNTFFQLSALLSIAAASKGKLKVAIPDLTLSVPSKREVRAFVDNACRSYNTVLHRMRPLLVPPGRLLESWPNWSSFGKCAPCSLGEVQRRQRRCLARGVRTCQVDVETLEEHGGTCLEQVRDVEDAADLPGELLEEALQMAEGRPGESRQEALPGAGGQCKVLWVTGFFQDHRYFLNHLPWLRRLFWHEPSAQEAALQLRKLVPEDATVISLHYRLLEFKPLGRCLEEEYYRAALSEAKRRIGKDLTCLIFSDDPQEALELSAGLELCSRRVAAPLELEDMTRLHMMALVPHCVLSASTFAYWAAILGPPKALVVTPQLQHPWFRFMGEVHGLEAWVAVPANFSGKGRVA